MSVGTVSVNSHERILSTARIANGFSSTSSRRSPSPRTASCVEPEASWSSTQRVRARARPQHRPRRVVLVCGAEPEIAAPARAPPRRTRARPGPATVRRHDPHEERHRRAAEPRPAATPRRPCRRARSRSSTVPTGSLRVEPEPRPDHARQANRPAVDSEQARQHRSVRRRDMGPALLAHCRQGPAPGDAGSTHSIPRITAAPGKPRLTYPGHAGVELLLELGGCRTAISRHQARHEELLHATRRGATARSGQHFPRSGDRRRWLAHSLKRSCQLISPSSPRAAPRSWRGRSQPSARSGAPP